MTTSSSMAGTSGVGRLRLTHPGGAPTRRPSHGSRGSQTRRFLIRVLVAAILIPLWFAFLAPRAVGGPLSMIWVSGTSMEPTLFTGDLAVLYRADAYQVGDIVAFEIPEGGTVIHRIIEVGPQGHRFQGDNRDFHDPWVLQESEILGRQVVSVPHAARLMTTVTRPDVLASLAVGLVVFWRMRRDDHVAKKKVGQPASDEADAGTCDPEAGDRDGSAPVGLGPGADERASRA